MKVVRLGEVRDLLAEWEKVRSGIACAEISGFSITVRKADGRETCYIGGHYRASPAAAARVALKMSALRVLEEDEPPRLTAS